MLNNRLEGIGWYMFENLKRMCINNPQHSFYFFFDRPYHSDFVFSNNVIPIVLKPQARHPFLYIIWFDVAVKNALKKYSIDVFFSPDGYTSLLTKVPTVLTIHDVYFEHNKHDFPFLAYTYLKIFIPLFIKKAKFVSTVSEFTKNDLMRIYTIDESKVSVSFNGVGDHFKAGTETEINAIRKKYSQQKPYFLFIGSLHHRKNLLNQLLAFDEFKKNNRSDIKFIVVGKRMWKFTELDKLLTNLNYADDIIFLGHCNQSMLVQLYQAALALCFVSKFEGFGIPIAEAFKSNIPVITSTTSCMPEIAGDAAILVDPNDIDAIAHAMNQISNSSELRNNLSKSGLERARLFSWDKSAASLMNLIEKAAT